MKKFWLALSALAALVLGGCNVGNAPEPMSASDVKAEVAKLSPEQQIDWINRSPMPPEEKARKIAEIKQKAGITGGPSGTGPMGGSGQPQ